MPFRYQQHQIPGGIAGTYATVEHIVRLIQQGEINPSVRQAAVDAIRRCPNKDKMCEAQAIFAWVKQHIKFVNDPWGAELLHEAESVLIQRAADCDDHVILNGAMLRSIGIQVRIVIIGANPQKPQSFSHIYLQASVRGTGWVGFDTSVPGVGFGWEPQAHTVKQIIEVP